MLWLQLKTARECIRSSYGIHTCSTAFEACKNILSFLLGSIVCILTGTSIRSTVADFQYPTLSQQNSYISTSSILEYSNIPHSKAGNDFKSTSMHPSTKEIQPSPTKKPYKSGPLKLMDSQPL